MITIVLIDVDEERKEKLINLISAHKDLVIQGTGKDNYEAIMLVKKFHPNIMLLDAALWVSTGIEISYTLKRYSASTEIVIFSSRVEDRLIQGMVNGKITSCLLMGSDMNRIAVILREINRGECYVNYQISARAFQILAGFIHGRPQEKGLHEEKANSLVPDFSQTELRILRLIAEGYSSKEIAQTLLLKDGTIRNYISSIIQKTGMKTRIQVVLYAIQNGFGKSKGFHSLEA